MGLMASGKTTLGRQLADELGRPLVDSDAAIEAATGKTAAEIAASEGIEALHAREADALLVALGSDTASVIAAAASTIDDPRCRVALVPAYVVWIRAEVDELVERVHAQGHRPLEGDVRRQLTEQAARRNPLFAEVADEIRDA